jgi:hypothetical protein
VYSDGDWKDKVLAYQHSFPVENVLSYAVEDTYCIFSNHPNWPSISDFIYENNHSLDDLKELDVNSISIIENEDYQREVSLYFWRRFCHKIGQIIIVNDEDYTCLNNVSHEFMHKENGLTSIFVLGVYPLIEDYIRNLISRRDFIGWNYKVLEND